MPVYSGGIQGFQKVGGTRFYGIHEKGELQGTSSSARGRGGGALSILLQGTSSSARGRGGGELSILFFLSFDIFRKLVHVTVNVNVC